MAPHLRLPLLVAASVAAIAAAITPAWAPGSLRLADVLTAVTAAPKLVAEIQAELTKNALAPDKVFCWAGRHGRHWIYLGGARAAPYSCTIGKRALTIDADITYFDSRGRNLGDVEHASPQRAKTFRQSNFRWSWSD